MEINNMYVDGHLAGFNAALQGKEKNEVPIARSPCWVEGFNEGYSEGKKVRDKCS